MSRKQRVTRAVYGVFVVFVAIFVASSIVQVARAVFFTPASEAESAVSPKVGVECGQALAEQIRAIDEAQKLASSEPNADAAKARYTSERRAWDDRDGTPKPKQACASDPHGPEALAAIARLDRTAEAHSIRDASELRAVRLTAQSFIRGHSR